jgi:ubiquinone/menaquinone biosynthesis C-methylase UbiE
MLAAADLRSSDRVLELACGAGGARLAAAPRVAEVVLSDVVPEMTSIAAARAAAAGLDNVTVRALDLEAIDEPDAAFDVALCREGLMLVPDPAQATRELARVLRPGGRAAIGVWALRARDPWLGLVFDAVAAETGQPGRARRDPGAAPSRGARLRDP